jgi:hypothetical protein
VSGELGVDEGELGRYRTEEIQESHDIDPTPVGLRLGVVRRERFHDCHQSSAMFLP